MRYVVPFVQPHDTLPGFSFFNLTVFPAIDEFHLMPRFIIHFLRRTLQYDQDYNCVGRTQ